MGSCNGFPIPRTKMGGLNEEMVYLVINLFGVLASIMVIRKKGVSVYLQVFAKIVLVMCSLGLIASIYTLW